MTAAPYITVMKFWTLLMLCMFSMMANAQIGYQVTLLNSATGEPRANETVNVTVTISNSANAIVCLETKSATTNEFGILSVAVGSENTFAKTDWAKLPFYISATVDGVMIGKSQLLSVPVAEHAKHTGDISYEFLNGKSFSHNYGDYSAHVSFSSTTFSYRGYRDSYSGTYYIVGNIILCKAGTKALIFIYCDGKLYYTDDGGIVFS